MLPGLNAAAVGLIVGSVVLLTLQIHASSPFPSATMCIGEIFLAELHSSHRKLMTFNPRWLSQEAAAFPVTSFPALLA